jgi:hypothetical protein
MGKTKKPSAVERFMTLSEAERKRQLAEFDRENVLDRVRPPTPAEAAKFRKAIKRAKAKRGRPRVGAGAERVLITIERKLLRRTDARARAEGASRAQLIARGLELVLAQSSATRRAG